MDSKLIFANHEIPVNLKTVEGYRVAVAKVTYEHGFESEEPVIIGMVFKGKKECLGTGIWNAFSGTEMYHGSETWKLKVDYL